MLESQPRWPKPHEQVRVRPKRRRGPRPIGKLSHLIWFEKQPGPSCVRKLPGPALTQLLSGGRRPVPSPSARATSIQDTWTPDTAVGRPLLGKVREQEESVLLCSQCSHSEGRGVAASYGPGRYVGSNIAHSPSSQSMRGLVHALSSPFPRRAPATISGEGRC